MALIEQNDKGENIYRYSEIFYSFQGEGNHTGKSSAWLRFFACNLTCSGFSQKDPTKPSTYELPYKTVDISNIKKIEDLPVFEFGCDSGYSWAKRFRHLAHQDTASTICDKIQDSIKHSTNPNGLFLHPETHQYTHIALTGGEPMLNQTAILKIIQEFELRYNLPYFVTVETNGTQPINIPILDKYIRKTYVYHSGYMPREWFWSVSPKLFSTSGEKFKRAIKPEVVGAYADISDKGQLKYVVNGTQRSWDEVEENTDLFRRAGVNWPVYIMPVGGTKEQQEENIIANIAIEAMKRGYYFSGRLHCAIFGNQIGT